MLGSIMIISQDTPLLVVFPGCDDSLPVRERSVVWSSLRQLGCLKCIEERIKTFSPPVNYFHMLNSRKPSILSEFQKMMMMMIKDWLSSE